LARKIQEKIMLLKKKKKKKKKKKNGLEAKVRRKFKKRKRS